MVEEVPAFVCTKCRYYELGEENAEKVREHELIQETGADRHLEGLIVESGSPQGSPRYLVFRRESLLNIKHEVLYTWETYYKETFEKVDSLPEDIKEMFDDLIDSMCSEKGFTPEHIRGRVLKSGFPHKELTQEELEETARELRSRYPDLYENMRFRRIIEL